MKYHNTNDFDANIVADSVNPQGDRITSMLVTYPRIVHAEMCRHRIHSRNTASSRAIPFKTMVKNVKEHPFIPIAWQKDHSGMQGTEYFIDSDQIQARKIHWLAERNYALQCATSLSTLDVTKQLCNRLLEPFVWVTELITATQWENFFELRSPQYHYEPENKYFKSRKDYLTYYEECFGTPPEINANADVQLEFLKINKSQADIHIQAIAELMWDAYNESTPKELEADEWHIPFGDNIDKDKLSNLEDSLNHQDTHEFELPIKIATARCARTSYNNYEGSDDYQKNINLHDRLLKYKHMSPFEHCAKAMNDEEHELFVRGKLNWTGGRYTKPLPDEDDEGWCKNFKGFIQYRYLIENNLTI